MTSAPALHPTVSPRSSATRAALTLYRAACLTTPGRVIITLLLLAVIRGQLFATSGLGQYFTSTQLAYYIDLDVYWKGGAALLDGQDIYNLSLPVGGITLPFTYPPISALLFGVLTWIPLDVATVMNYLLTVFVTYWLLVQVFTILLGRTAAGRVFAFSEKAETRWDSPSSGAVPAGKKTTASQESGADVSSQTHGAASSSEPDRSSGYPTTFTEMNPTLLAFAALPIVLLIEPVLSTLNFGQINVYLMALVALDLLLPHTRWPRGIWVGLAAAIKLTPAVFGLYFLIRKQWIAAVTCVASALVWTGLAWVIRPSDSSEYWFHTLHDPSRIGGLAYSGNQSLRGMIARFVSDDHTQSLVWMGVSAVVFVIAAVAMWRVENLRGTTAFADGAAAQAGGMQTAGVQAAGATNDTQAQKSGRADAGENQSPAATMPAVPSNDRVITLVQAAVNSLVALLISPVSWSHHWVWFIAFIPICIAAAVRTRHWVPTALAIGGSLVVTVLQFHWFFPHSDNREMAWNFVQKILGSDFVVFGLFFLIAVLCVPGVFTRVKAVAHECGGRA